MIYTDPHAAEWDVAGVENFTLFQVNRIQAEMESMVVALGLELLVVDIELCGSYAFGCARPHSDLDIAIVALDATGQAAIDRRMRTLGDQSRKLRYQAAVNLGIKVDFAWKNHDNKAQGNVVYSLRTRLLHGRRPGEPVLVRRRWNDASKTWDLVERKERIWQVLVRATEAEPGKVR